jgi:ABC-type branched-subunit amino acid transport system ATPase component
MNRDELPLRDLTVEGYRGIRHLQLPELGRVNLFVGKNNAGKSSLLEAIRLGLEENSSAIAALVYDALREHTDFIPVRRAVGVDQPIEAEEIETVVTAVESLFFGGLEAQPTRPIRISESSQRYVEIHGPRSEAPDLLDLFGGPVEEGFFGPNSPLLTIRTQHGTRVTPLRLFIRSIPVRFRDRGETIRVSANTLSSFAIRELWDRLAVLGNEEVVEDAMRSVWPSFERALSAGDNGRRSVFIKLQGSPRAVPLQSLGDGVQRVFAITVSLALSAGGALVIDEVENGLHHTAQQEVWDAIFRLSEQMDVQVFATTHSWESVVAFQEAANRSHAKGMLYRLEREADGQVYAERYTEKDVAVAAEQQVEVR